MAKTHYEAASAPAGPATMALCGWFDVPLTKEVEEVTCALCIRRLAKRVAEQPVEAPFEASGPYAVPKAARELSEADMRALERGLRGHGAPRYAWRSAQQALRALLIYEADGQGLGSTSNPSRFEKAPRGLSDPTWQVTGKVDRFHGVKAARARAYAGPRALTSSECSCCGSDRTCPGARSVVTGHFELSVEHQIQILDWSMEMVRKKGDPVPVSTSPYTIVERAEDRWGLRVTERHVALVRDAGLRAVSAHLRAIGEMAPAPKAATAGREVGDVHDLSGWDEIEEYTKMSRAVLRRLACRAEDPMPITKFDGVKKVFATRADLDGWRLRNRQGLSDRASETKNNDCAR